ncbi:MAG TPA: type II toxin-antitoxin system HicB family antitoxin [Longimicrobiales bacterium]|nr:type II toxin-antitoxin system HicB family antitoxin [Longimicrobiales bacterium]
MDAPRYSADLRWSDEDRAWVAVCPELADLSVVADTRREALLELEEVVAAAMEVYEAEGRPLPDPAVHVPFSGQFRVRLPRTLHGWLVREARREGVSLNTLVIARLAQGKGEGHGSRAIQAGRRKGA